MDVWMGEWKNSPEMDGDGIDGFPTPPRLLSVHFSSQTDLKHLGSLKLSCLERVEKYWHDAPSLENFSQVGWGSEQPGLVEGLLAGWLNQMAFKIPL